VAVVQAESFSGAAATLGVAKSTVSKQVRALEAHLGSRLLERTTRSLRLTDVGAAFYAQCAEVVSAAQEAELAVTQLQPTPCGRLRVTAPVSFGQRVVVDVVDDFLTFYPEVSVDLQLSDRVANLVDEGYDLAIRIGGAPDSSLVSRHLVETRLVMVGSPSYLAAHGTPQTPADLGAHHCLLQSDRPAPDHWTFDGPDGEYRVRVHGRLRVNSIDALAAAASDGQGLAMLPDFAVRGEVQAGRLVSVLRDMCQRLGAVYAVYPDNRHLSAKVRVFVDLLAGCLGPDRSLSGATSFSR